MWFNKWLYGSTMWFIDLVGSMAEPWAGLKYIYLKDGAVGDLIISGLPWHHYFFSLRQQGLDCILLEVYQGQKVLAHLCLGD